MKLVTLLSFLIPFVLAPSFVLAQVPTKQQAEAQLKRMTPEEIDAKIRQFGMTRAEAEAKAKAFGIDLDAYLNQLPAGAPVSTSPQINISIPVQQGSTALSGDTTVAGSLSPKVEAAEAAALGNAAQAVAAPVIPPPLKGDDSRIFGLSFFRSAAPSFEASPSIADKDYIIGAGDVLKISLWGQLQTMSEVTVDREGRITVAPVGSILVAGYSIDDARRRVIAALSQSYAGLVAQPPTIYMDFSLSKLRPVRVFIMGEVNNPGGYFVNNFASVFNSLFVVGGPKPSGSLRDVRVIRNGKLGARVDLYDYLLGSPKTNDIRVNDNDIIYVPLKGRTVDVRGEVLRSAIFELKQDEQLKALLEFSGGIRTNVYRDRIQVDRVIPFAKRAKGDLERRVFDVEFADIVSGKKDYTVEDKDIITLFSILDKKENYVEVLGDVKRPGTYQIDQLRTVKDLIDAADGLWPTAYLKRAELTRQYPNDKLQEFTLDLEKVLKRDPQHNLALEMRDRLRIFSMYDINPARTVTFTGHLKSPGTLAYADSMTVGKMLRYVGGLEDSLFRAQTFLDRADLIRLNPDLITRTTLPVDVGRILSGDAPDFPLLAGDELRVYALADYRFLDKTVQIGGRVKRPGEYRLTEGMTLTDLVLAAGGYTEDAWTKEAEVARVLKRTVRGDSLVQLLHADLPDLMDTSRASIDVINSRIGKLMLQDKDQVYVRPDPNYRLQELVTVAGEVLYPGAYALVTPRARISTLIQRAGGLKPTAYARGGQLDRDSVRFRTNIEEALSDPGGNYDAILQPGDRIRIDRAPNTVQVLGEVNNPGNYSFVRGRDMDFYIENAGGTTDSADYALVTYPEGFIEQAHFTFLFGDNPNIPDGSAIYVKKVIPEPPEPITTDKQTTTFEFVKDMLAIVVSSATIIVLATKL